jgi:osmotically inducible protein OsmC
MATRTARTAWDGGLQDGSGQVELSSSKVGTYDVSFPRRTADDAGGTTSPEELVAAAHSACFAMQLSGLVAAEGGTPVSLEVTADVTLGPDSSDGGLKLTGITLTVKGEVEGLDAAGFQRAAEGAKATCPISKALTGVEITLKASLVE